MIQAKEELTHVELNKNMTQNNITPDILSEEESRWDEEWVVILNDKGQYELSKMQALIVREAIATGSRGIVMFETFSISIPYIVEFYRQRRFLRDTKLLSERAVEKEYKSIDPKKWAEFKKKVYENLGKSPTSTNPQAPVTEQKNQGDKESSSTTGVV